MEEAQMIFDYLPASYKNPTEREYVDFLWDAFLTNYNAGKYPFAFLAYHMLFMCFVYFEIWQIKANCKDDFHKSMVGFNKDVERELLNSDTPFALWQVNESGAFRFLKLIGMDNSDIGQCAKIVQHRNEAAHSNGNIFFNSKETLQDKIEEILRCVDKIQTYSKSIIESCFERFLLESGNPEEREFADEADQIREMFIHNNYLSQKDIEIAKDYPIEKLQSNEHYDNMKSLCIKMKDIYCNGE